MKVEILHDAISATSRPDEVDALHQAELVGKSLRVLGHEVSTTAANLNLEATSAAFHESAPDLVFNLVESLAGYGRLIHVVPALLEALGIPFTGSGSIACLVTTNKPLTKAWLHERRIPTPAWRYQQLPALTEITPPCACIVKPACEDASVGIDDGAVIHISRHGELDKAIQAARRNENVFLEQFVEGREFNLSLLADGDDVEILPVAEMEFVDYPTDKPRIVGYAAKWSEESFEYGATRRRFDFAHSDDSLLQQLCSLAIECWHLFGLRGYARVDFRVDSGNRPWVLEVNVNPCLSADAGFMAAARRRGLADEEVIARIVTAATVPCLRKEVASHA